MICLPADRRPAARPRERRAVVGAVRLRLLPLAMAVALALAGCGAGEAPPPPAREWTDPGQTVAGDWALYYNAFPSADLEPAMAAAYAVQPRARGAIVTVSLTKGGDPKAGGDADVSIEARTLLGQARAVRTRRIEREGVVSWLGELDADERETLVFSVKARVPDLAAPVAAEFRREFHGGE
jgi:hypothetical protein